MTSDYVITQIKRVTFFFWDTVYMYSMLVSWLLLCWNERACWRACHSKVKMVPRFKEYDRDGNGYVSLDEATGILQNPPFNFPASKVGHLLVKFDKDGNGKLDIEEFADFYAEAKATYVLLMCSCNKDLMHDRPSERCIQHYRLCKPHFLLLQLVNDTISCYAIRVFPYHLLLNTTFWILRPRWFFSNKNNMS